MFHILKNAHMQIYTDLLPLNKFISNFNCYLKTLNNKIQKLCA